MRNAILSLILAMLACLISSNIAVPANNTINANIAMPAKAIEGFTSPCVTRAKETCDKKVWPAGSTNEACVTVDKLLWHDPMSRFVSKCYCDSRGLQDRWWECFYPAVAMCPQTDDTIKALHYQEWEVHRYTRRLHCVDDYKPDPPWDKMKSEFLKARYNTDDDPMYIDDYVR